MIQKRSLEVSTSRCLGVLKNRVLAGSGINCLMPLNFFGSKKHLVLLSMMPCLVLEACTIVPSPVQMPT